MSILLISSASIKKMSRRVVCLRKLMDSLLANLEECLVFVFPFCLFEAIVFATRDIARSKLRLYIDGYGRFVVHRLLFRREELLREEKEMCCLLLKSKQILLLS